MAIFDNHLGLYTDFYELTMAQGYFYHRKEKESATFDYFFRTNPFKGGFTVFAGLQDFLDLLSDFTFSKTDIAFLKEQNLQREFLDYLKDFRFRGKILSVREGEIVFPNEPILRVEGSIIECQIIESLLLNIINFESLVATKAFRIKLVSEHTIFSDFGLRRAQGFGALHASRAACIGGATSTSNVLAGKLFNLPVTGTQAHSWIQSFNDELQAFRAFAEVHKEKTVLLVDTFNTLTSGVPNAIIVAKELEQKGQRLKAIRLDSGDLAYFSRKARKMLDDADLNYVKIIASNQLNEYVVKSLLHDQKAPIDAFGIGTELITGKKDAALDGVYKLAEIDGSPKMKFSENVEKITLPGKKQLIRFFDENGYFYRDGLLCEEENPEEIEILYHPVHPGKSSKIEKLRYQPLQQKVMEDGQRIIEKQSPAAIHNYLKERVRLLPPEHQRFISPHIYKVGISKKLMETRNNLAKQLKM